MYKIFHRNDFLLDNKSDKLLLNIVFIFPIYFATFWIVYSVNIFTEIKI